VNHAFAVSQDLPESVRGALSPLTAFKPGDTELTLGEYENLFLKTSSSRDNPVEPTPGERDRFLGLVTNFRLKLLDEFLDLPYERIEVSATEGTGLGELRRHVFERLGIVRVYTKHPKQKEPDMTKPFAIPDIWSEITGEDANSDRIWSIN